QARERLRRRHRAQLDLTLEPEAAQDRRHQLAVLAGAAQRHLPVCERSQRPFDRRQLDDLRASAQHDQDPGPSGRHHGDPDSMPEKPVTASQNDPSSEDPSTLDLDVCVVGLGYVGLPTAAVLATRGRRVAGFDLRRDILDTINAGQIHIVEPELDALVRAAVLAGTLRAVPEPVAAQTFLICVPTPIRGDRGPDLSAVESASRALAPVLRPGNLVVLESTVPPGTLRELVAPILRQSGLTIGEDLFVA